MNDVEALAFDVGGSVFDWKSAVRVEIHRRALAAGVEVDADQFADEWRVRMFSILDRVRNGELQRINSDWMHRLALEDIAPNYAQMKLSGGELDAINTVWHRMPVWPEFPDALTRLREHYRVVVLTVLSFASVVDSSKHNGISWDGVLSCEFLERYKPDPESYRQACRLLGLEPVRVMMVATHPLDLAAARSAGLQTAFVRPKFQEPERAGISSKINTINYNIVAADYTDLADRLCVTETQE